MTGARLGVVTIGQSPREDMVPAMLPWLGIEASRVVERGALDGLSRERISELAPPRRTRGGARGDAPSDADAVLTTRLADGSSVQLEHRHVVGLLTETVREVEQDPDIGATLVVCSSTFPPIPHTRPLLFAEPLLTAAVRGIVPWGGRLGVVCPLPEQAATLAAKWRYAARGGGAPDDVGDADGREACGAGEVVVRPADPYRAGADESVAAAAAELAAEGAAGVVLDCMGYTTEAKHAANRSTGLPILLAREVVARVAGAVVA